MTCGIYMIRNKANGKMYIGQAVDIEDRWKRHTRVLKSDYHINKHLQRAWNKYGEESFEFNILLECEENQLNTYEQYYIFELMTYDDKVGYNKNYGGYSGRPTEETRKKMSEASKGKTKSEETRRKMSENHANFKGEKHPMYGRTGENNPNYGKHLSEETKKKMREARKSENNLNNKPVVQINPNTNEIKMWKSAKEAERQGGFCHSKISLCCNGKQKLHKGYKWMFLSDYNKLNE